MRNGSKWVQKWVNGSKWVKNDAKVAAHRLGSDPELRAERVARDADCEFLIDLAVAIELRRRQTWREMEREAEKKNR